MSNCFADFLQNQGLYESITITKENINDLCELVGGKIKLSEYCVECGEKRVFTSKPITFLYENDKKKSGLYSLEDSLKRIQIAQELYIPELGATPKERPDWYWKSPITEEAVRIMVFSFECAMDNTHHLDYVVKTEGNMMVKIGQFPSVADLSFPMIEDYKKDLDKQSRNELRRAVGLYAHGIGVGSFVYLRRIFENILEKARSEAEQEGLIDISGYKDMHVDERVKLLNMYLPSMLNKYPKLYSIVSKGIHELSEEECRNYFPILRDSILLVLEQWSEKRKKQERERDLEASLNAISSEIR